MPTYQHRDSLKQDIQVGQPIAFTSSYLKGVKIGIVKRLTKCRVRIHYKYTYTNKEGQVVNSAWDTQIEPKRTIVLIDTLPPTLTMYLLKNG